MPDRQESESGVEEPPLEGLWNRAKRLAILYFGLDPGLLRYRVHPFGFFAKTYSSIDISEFNHPVIGIRDS